MNFGELVTAVIQGDFEPSNAAGLVTAVKEWLNEAYLEIADRDLICFEKEEVLTLEAGITEYDLFDDYRKMYNAFTEENGPIDIQDKRRFDYVRHHMNLKTVTGPPKDGIVVGKKLQIHPIPDLEYALYCTYYHIPERMVADTDTHLIPGTKENLLIIFAQSKFKLREKDASGSKELKNEFEGKLMRWEIDDFHERSKDQVDILQLQREHYTRFGRRVT